MAVLSPEMCSTGGGKNGREDLPGMEENSSRVNKAVAMAEVFTFPATTTKTSGTGAVGLMMLLFAGGVHYNRSPERRKNDW